MPKFKTSPSRFTDESFLYELGYISRVTTMILRKIMASYRTTTFDCYDFLTIEINDRPLSLASVRQCIAHLSKKHLVVEENIKRKNQRAHQYFLTCDATKLHLVETCLKLDELLPSYSRSPLLDVMCYLSEVDQVQAWTSIEENTMVKRTQLDTQALNSITHGCNRLIKVTETVPASRGNPFSYSLTEIGHRTLNMVKSTQPFVKQLY